MRFCGPISQAAADSRDETGVYFHEFHEVFERLLGVSLCGLEDLRRYLVHPLVVLAFVPAILMGN